MKLSKVWAYNNKHEQKLRGYRIGLKMSEIQKHNFQGADFDIEYFDDHIVLKVKTETTK